MGTSCKGATSKRPRALLQHRPAKVKIPAIYVVTDKKGGRLTLQDFNRRRSIPMYSIRVTRVSSKYSPNETKARRAIRKALHGEHSRA